MCRSRECRAQNRSPRASRCALPTGRMRDHIVWKKSARPAICAAPASSTVQRSHAAPTDGRSSSPSTRAAVPAVTSQYAHSAARGL